MKTNRLQKFFKTPAFSITTSALTIIVAYFISYLENNENGINLIISAAFVTAVAIGSIGIYSIYANEELEDKVEILKDFIKSYGLGSIINEKALMIWESSAKTIWVITLDLSNDIGIENDKKTDKKIVDIVKLNLKQGKKYVYFVPDTNKINGAIKEYKKIHSKCYKKGQVRFCIIPKEQFHFINEVILYDLEEDAPTRAVQWFPNKELNYYLEIDKFYQLPLIGVLNNLIKKYGLIDINDIK